MKKTASRQPKRPDEGGVFRALAAYVAAVSQGRMRKGQLFPLCIRASFSKCYEFNLEAWNESASQGEFFSLPTLRGICEDLIVLNYLKSIPTKQRDLLLSKLMAHDVHTRLATQKGFFSTARPLQPVLNPQLSPAAVTKLESEIQTVWRSHGWPNMNRGVMPPIRQIAEKQGGDILIKLYDFLYRLTSGTVHFSVGSLLRTGWGDPPHFTFSVKHFAGYYRAFSRVYGAFMFCSYFELFGRFLRPDNNTKRKVDVIRDSILSVVRWPEMITFEEMNIPVPDPGIIINALGVVLSRKEKRLLS